MDALATPADRSSVPDHTQRILFALTAIIGLAGMLLAAIDVQRGPWDHDGGFFLLHASYVARGFRPYLDYVSIYPPLMELINAAPVAIGLDRVILTEVIPFAWIVANSMATAVLVWSLTRSRHAALLGAALFPFFSVESEGNHVTLEQGVVFFSCLALAVAARSALPKDREAILAGSLVSAASLTKQNGILIILPILALWSTNDARVLIRRGLLLAIGGLLPLLAILAWLRFGLAAIGRNLVQQFFVYATQTGVEGGLLHNELARSRFTVAAFLIVAASVVVALARSSSRRMTLLVLSCTVVILLNVAARFHRNYPHYDLNAWPAAVVAVSVALSSIRARNPVAAWAGGVICGSLLVIAFFTQPGLTLRWVSAGRLTTTFAPAARTLIQLDPRRTARVRQYGAESIIEYLSGHLPDPLSLSYSQLSAQNDGRSVYDLHPPKDELVLIVDRGQPWAEQTRRALEASGWKTVASNGGRPVVVHTLVFPGATGRQGGRAGAGSQLP
jgi:hypothetical protein